MLYIVSVSRRRILLGVHKWTLLAAAIVCEVTATMSLRAFQDDARWLAVVIAGYAASFVFLARVLRAGVPVGVAYGIWGACGTALWLWTQGQVGAGAVAAVIAMALRISGMSHWIMWEMTSLFENIGTVQDGVGTLSRPRAVVDAPGAATLAVALTLLAALAACSPGGDAPKGPPGGGMPPATVGVVTVQPAAVPLVGGAGIIRRSSESPR